MEKTIQQAFAWAHVGGAALYLGALWLLWAHLRRAAPRRTAALWRYAAGPLAFLSLFAGVGSLHLNQPLMMQRAVQVWAGLWLLLMALDATLQWAWRRRAALRWMRPLGGALGGLSLAFVAVGVWILRSAR